MKNSAWCFRLWGGFEILPEGKFQRIPWVANWVQGVINVRGEVYTVVDFARYIGLPVQIPFIPPHYLCCQTLI